MKKVKPMMELKRKWESDFEEIDDVLDDSYFTIVNNLEDTEDEDLQDEID